MDTVAATAAGELAVVGGVVVGVRAGTRSTTHPAVAPGGDSDVKKHPHRLSHTRMATFDMGELVPMACVEVLPNDTFRHSTSLFMRLTPLAAPVMHDVDVRLHHFYVPWRLVWEDAGGTGSWEDFITGGTDGLDAQNVPTMTSTGVVGDVLDYIGIPPVSGVAVSALPVAAYNFIYNEWYRDQDLVTARALNNVTLAKCAWGKDYFTSARPFPQRGDAISMPLGTSAPVATDKAAGNGPLTVVTPSGARDLMADAASVYPHATTGAASSELYADLSAATAATVADLRLAFALQRFQELRARFGARYPEYLNSYGIKNQDGRLQLPEFLGGGSSQVQFSEVMQTSPTTAAGGRTYDIGDLYGHGIAAMRSNAYAHTFPEWGCVMTLASVRPRAMYMDGIHRSWLRQDREDFWDPTLENIGDQSVYKNEVYADSVDGTDVWAYQGRYDDYRFHPSGVSGEFRDVLDHWHLGRQFATDPALNETFITCDPSKRIFNEATQNSLWVKARHNIQSLRGVSSRATTRTL